MPSTPVSRQRLLLAAALGLASLCLPPALRATPQQASGPPPALTDLGAAASQLPELRSLLVSWRGTLIAEHYARGVRPTTLANVKSASKSIIAALVGIALIAASSRACVSRSSATFPSSVPIPIAGSRRSRSRIS